MIATLAEVVDYRELIRNLVARDLKVRYRNSILGFVWCLLNPLLMMAVFTFVFTILMKSNIPKYPVFILIGILAWNFHTTAVNGSITSIVGNSQLVMKVYFPREVLPISVVLSNAVNFVLALIALFLMMAAFRMPVGVNLLFLPVIIAVQVVFSVGLGLCLAALTVLYRDVEIITETVLTAWFFLTPIIYRMEDLFPLYSRIMYIANPMASIISAYRDVLYTNGLPASDFFIRTTFTSFVVLGVGLYFFRRTAKRFGEEL